MRSPQRQEHKCLQSDSEGMQLPSTEQELNLCPWLQDMGSEKDMEDDDDYSDDDDDDILYVANPEELHLNMKKKKEQSASRQGKRLHSPLHRFADILFYSVVFNKSLQLHTLKPLQNISSRPIVILHGLENLNQIIVPKEDKLTILDRSTLSSKDSRWLCLQLWPRSNPVFSQNRFSLSVRVTCVKAGITCGTAWLTTRDSKFCSSFLFESEEKKTVSVFLSSNHVPVRHTQLAGLQCMSAYRTVDEDEQVSSDVGMDVSESDSDVKTVQDASDNEQAFSGVRMDVSQWDSDASDNEVCRDVGMDVGQCDSDAKTMQDDYNEQACSGVGMDVGEFDSDAKTMQDASDKDGHGHAVSAGYTGGKHEPSTGMDTNDRGRCPPEITSHSTVPVHPSPETEVSAFLASQQKYRPEAHSEHKDGRTTAKENASLDLQMKMMETDQRGPCSVKVSLTEKGGKKNKEDGSDGNADENSLSWLYSTSSFIPGMSEIAVAMLKTTTHHALPTPSIHLGQPGMESEWHRLATFYNFAAPAGVFVLPIAAAGFFLAQSTEYQDSNRAKVECAFCGVAVEILKFVHKSALDVHSEMSPGCRFVQGRESVGNVSFPQIEENTASQFLHEFTAQAHSRGPPQHIVDLQADAESVGYAPAVERLAAPTTTSSLPTTKGFTGSATPVSTQNATPRLTAASAAEGQTETDARMIAAPAATGNTDQSSLSAAAGRSHTARSSGPLQSATVAPTPAQGESSPSENRAASESLNTNTSTPAEDNSQSNPAHPQANVVESASGGTARVETPSSAPAPLEEPAGESEGDRGTGQDRQVVTYDDLGIFAQRPKRPDLALKSTRINTFTNWPHNDTHPAEEMAEAGFYFTAHEDLVRCFHCKGGLKTWESSDKSWVEHSRWFPKCPFVRLCKGQRFVDAVQKLNNPETRPTISEEAVQREMDRMEMEERSKLGSDVFLLSRLPTSRPERDPTLGAVAREGLKVGPDTSEASLKQLEKDLEDENEEMRDSTRCKMCQINDVNVLFLPCGHLVSCAQCAPALRTCAMCRQQVKGSVRVYLEDKYTSLGAESNTGSRTVTQQDTT